MNVSKRARALAVLAASASLVAVPLAVPAGAVQSVKCTKLTTKTVGTTITATVSNCTPTAATGGKGSGAFKSSGKPNGSLNVTIKWAAGKGTTKGNIIFKTQPTDGKCVGGAQVTRIKITGKVTGGTGVAVKTIKPNEPITGSVCSHATKGITLEPGTSLKF